MKYIITITLLMFICIKTYSQEIYCSKDTLVYESNNYKALDSIIIHNSDKTDLRIDSIFTKRFYYKVKIQSQGIIKDWGYILMRNCPNTPIIVLSEDSVKLFFNLMIPTAKIGTLSSLTIDSIYIYNNSYNKPFFPLSVYNYIKMGIEDDQHYPTIFSLSQNYPNPFNPTTKIKYSIQNSEKVLLKVYDVLGREVETLLNEYENAGTYEIEFDGSNFTSGLYFYKITSGNYSETRKMILLR